MKALIVGSIDKSPFIKTDLQIIAQFCKIDSVNIIGSLDKDKWILQYYDIVKVILFELLPKSIKTDIIYVWFIDVHAFAALIIAKFFRKKLIVVLGGYEVCNMPEINYGLQRNIIRGKLAKIVIKYANNCIVPSQSYFERLSSYGGTISILPTCTKVIYPKEIEKENSIIMVGNATERDYLLKGIPVYNEIASKISAPCYLIGDYDESIKNKYSNIIYKGHVDHKEVIYLMSKSKIYCQLSHTESFGVSVLEAMSVGCIPIVSNVDNLKNFIEADIPGLYSNNTNEIIEHINEFLTIKTSNYSEKLINNTRSNILKMCRQRKIGIKKLMGVESEDMFYSRR